MISELDSGWSSSGSNTGPMRFDLGHDSYNTSFYPVMQKGTGEFNAGMIYIAAMAFFVVSLLSITQVLQC